MSSAQMFATMECPGGAETPRGVANTDRGGADMADGTELSEADPCVVCGTTGGSCGSSGRPARTRGACHRCYMRYHRAGRVDELDPIRFDARGFLQRVIDGRIDPDEGGCILWPGCIRNGYATVNWYGDVQQATHVVLDAVVGPRPSPRHQAAHAPHEECGNTSCVNPDHLRWATPEENQADRIGDGTSNRGQRHGMAKLTRNQVSRIRELHASEDVTYSETAKRFGVASETIRGIVLGERWAHLVTEVGS